jgi:hypothetical protein
MQQHNRDTMARTAHKWQIFLDVARPVWLNEPLVKGKRRPDALDRTVFSMDAAPQTRWYQELDAERTGKGASLSEVMKQVVSTKMLALNVNFYKDSTFMTNGRGIVALYVQWCDQFYEGDYAMNSVNKAHDFIQYFVDQTKANNKERVKKGQETKHVDETAFNSWRRSIYIVERLAQWQGYDEYAERLSRYERINVQWKTLKAARDAARQLPRDMARDSRFQSKRLTTDEESRMFSAVWSGTAVESYVKADNRDRAQVRKLATQAILDMLGRRGEDTRGIRTAMLFLHKISHVKPVDCTVVGISMRGSKENTNVEEFMMGLVRAANREACPVAALAIHFVYNNDISPLDGVPLLTIMEEDLEDLRDLRNKKSYNPKWWKMYTFHTVDTKEEMHYSTHRKDIQRAFDAGEVKGKSAKTHIFRNKVACDLIEKGVPFSDVGLYQGWWHDTAANHYLLASFKTNAALHSAGWNGPTNYNCWWESSGEDIPAELLPLVFPGLDELYELAKAVEQETNMDLSAVKVCEVLMYLRKVFLEDAAVLQPKYPNFAAYRTHPVFRHSAWKAYAEAEPARIEERQRLYELRNRDPELSSLVMKEMAKKDEAIEKLNLTLEKVLAGQATQTPPPPPTQAEGDGPIPILFEPSNMRIAYDLWRTQQRQNFLYYEEKGTRIPWKQLHKEGANTVSVRYHKMRPWLSYLDAMEPAAAESAIEKLSDIADRYKMEHGAFIKGPFYHLVHPPKEGTQLPIPLDTLRTEMERAHLPIPEAKEKRTYNKRKAEEEDTAPAPKRSKK